MGLKVLDVDGLLHFSSDWYDDGMGREDDKRWLYCEVRAHERHGGHCQLFYEADEIEADPTCLLCIVDQQDREAEAAAMLRDIVNA